MRNLYLFNRIHGFAAGNAFVLSSREHEWGLWRCLVLLIQIFRMRMWKQYCIQVYHIFILTPKKTSQKQRKPQNCSAGSSALAISESISKVTVWRPQLNRKSICTQKYGQEVDIPLTSLNPAFSTLLATQCRTMQIQEIKCLFSHHKRV